MREVTTSSFVGAAITRRLLTAWSLRYSEGKNKKLTPALKKIILEKYFFNNCAYCEKSVMNDLVWDHATPINKTHFGLNVFGNLVPAHGRCNSEKLGKPWQAYLEEKNLGVSPTFERIRLYEKEAHNLGIETVLPKFAQKKLVSIYEKFAGDAALEINAWRELGAQHANN